MRGGRGMCRDRKMRGLVRGATGATDVEAELTTRWKRTFSEKPLFPFSSGAQAHFRCPVGMFLEDLWNADTSASGTRMRKSSSPRRHWMPGVGDDDAGRGPSSSIRRDGYWLRRRAGAEAEPGAGHRIGVSQIKGGTLQRSAFEIHLVAFSSRVPQQEIVTSQRQYLLPQRVARARPHE